MGKRTERIKRLAGKPVNAFDTIEAPKRDFDPSGAHPMTAQTQTPESIAEQRAKDAAIEYLSHRGENPYRILRGGQALWETHLPAMRAALSFSDKRHSRQPSPPDVVERARLAHVAVLRDKGLFDTTIGDASVEAFREAMRAALQAAGVTGWRADQVELLAECYARLYDNYREVGGGYEGPPEPADEWSYNIIPTFTAIQRATGKNHDELMALGNSPPAVKG